MRVLHFARGWIAVGWLLVACITVASLVPPPAVTPGLPFVDKLVHLAAYLFVMAWFAQIWSSRRALAAHAFFLILLGVILELLQGSLGHRSADAVDAIANVGGVLLGRLTTRPPGSGLLERLETRFGLPQ